MKYENQRSYFADRLQSLINESGITIKKLSEETDISTGTLSKYQNDEAEAGIEKLSKLANHFKVSADYLLGLSNVKSSDMVDKEIGKKLKLSDVAIKNIITINKWGFPLSIEKEALSEITSKDISKIGEEVKMTVLDMILSSRYINELLIKIYQLILVVDLRRQQNDLKLFELKTADDVLEFNKKNREIEEIMFQFVEFKDLREPYVDPSELALIFAQNEFTRLIKDMSAYYHLYPKKLTKEELLRQLKDLKEGKNNA